MPEEVPMAGSFSNADYLLGDVEGRFNDTSAIFTYNDNITALRLPVETPPVEDWLVTEEYNNKPA